MTRTVAAFDFDGTMRRGDSLLPFLRMVVPARRLATAAVRAGRPLLAAVAGGARRDVAKEAVLAHALAGLSFEAATAAGEIYARRLEHELRDDVAARARWHVRAGHEVIIVSASPELYLAPLGRLLGFDAVVATRLEERDGRLTGRLLGPNVRGPEKARRMAEWLVGDRVFLWAYGDSQGDAELLAGADRATWVTRHAIPEEPPEHAARDGA